MPEEGVPRRAVVLDFHTMHDIPDVGRDFDADSFGRTLAEAGVDLAILAARCNRGFAYYPSRIGTPHPSLGFDLFGQMAGACRSRGIRTAAYFHAGLDHEHLLRRRDWARVDAAGNVYDLEGRGHYFRKPCLNTGYGAYLLATVAEVLDSFPVDDLFLDGLEMDAECHGFECLDGMRLAGMDPLSRKDRRAFAEKTVREFVEKVRRIATDCGRPVGAFFNGLPFECQESWVALEALPGLGWGYDYLPAALRHVRTLCRPYFVLTSRFQNGFGDFGGFPPEHSLRFDCLQAVANGGGAGVIDCLHPRARPEKDVYGVIGKIFSEIRELERWTADSTPVADMAILDPEVSHARAGGQHDYAEGVRGAARMLSELRCQFDVVSGRSDFSRYRTLILPDAVRVDEELAEALGLHLRRGGAVVTSGTSGIDQDVKDFVIPGPPWRVLGREACDPGYFEAEAGFDRGLPSMPIGIYARGVSLETDDPSDVAARFLAPYANLGAWDGFHETVYAPPDRPNGRAAVLRRGNRVHVSFPLFSSYLAHGVIPYRMLLRNLLEAVMPEPLVAADGAPSFVQVVLGDAPGRRLVHVLAYAAEGRGERLIVEEPLLVENLRLTISAGTCVPRSVRMAPAGDPVPFIFSGGCVELVLKRVRGYQLLVIES